MGIVYIIMLPVLSVCVVKLALATQALREYTYDGLGACAIYGSQYHSVYELRPQASGTT